MHIERSTNFDIWEVEYGKVRAVDPVHVLAARLLGQLLNKILVAV